MFSNVPVSHYYTAVKLGPDSRSILTIPQLLSVTCLGELVCMAIDYVQKAGIDHCLFSSQYTEKITISVSFFYSLKC